MHKLLYRKSKLILRNIQVVYPKDNGNFVDKSCGFYFVKIFAKSRKQNDSDC